MDNGDTIGYARLVIIQGRFDDGFFGRCLLGLDQMGAGTIGYIIIHPFFLGKAVIMVYAIAEHPRAGNRGMFHQDKLEIFPQRFDHRFFVHFVHDTVDLKSTISQKSKVKKGQTHLRCENDTGTAVLHPLHDEDTAEVLAYHVYLGIVHSRS